MNDVRRARPLLGTVTQISVRGPHSERELNAAVSAAFEQIARVHALMSWHQPDSELSRLNRCAFNGIEPVHPHTRAVLDAALAFASWSDGAFDPTVAGTLTRWGLLPLPERGVSPDEQRGTWRDIELSAEGVRFHRPLWLDLGGIAKGYAVDVAVQCMKEQGIPDIVVNAGGDLCVAGEAHPVALRHPQSAHCASYEMLLDNEALATSSAFESRRDTAQGAVSALVDPATDRPYAGVDSVSVRAPTCMTADALTKVALFASPSIAESVFDRYGAHCIRLKV